MKEQGDSRYLFMTTQKVLKERGKTHGNFEDNARIAQGLKAVVQAEETWEDLPPTDREAIDQVFSKLARWISAPKYHDDNATDIIGYVTLADDLH